VDTTIPIPPNLETRALLGRWIENIRETFGAVNDILEENEHLRGIVAALQRERDELCERCAELSEHCQREAQLRADIEDPTGTVLAEIKRLITNAKEQRAAQEPRAFTIPSSPTSRGSVRAQQ
jgi:predicted RNase H-like nuclease (RuvC/YqgF family)